MSTVDAEVAGTPVHAPSLTVTKPGTIDAATAGEEAREIDTVSITWGDARKHRQRIVSRAGREVVIDLPRGTFLKDGEILYADELLVLVVERPAEPAIVVDFGANLTDHAHPVDPADVVRRALLLGYQLGNQHAPLDLDTRQLRVPLMTGAETARRSLADLHLIGEVCEVPLAAHGWATTSADHREGHSHDHPGRTA